MEAQRLGIIREGTWNTSGGPTGWHIALETERVGVPVMMLLNDGRVLHFGVEVSEWTAARREAYIGDAYWAD